MAKKKKYKPNENDDWDIESDREHRRVIMEKQKQISAKYKKWWDVENKKWKEGLDGH